MVTDFGARDAANTYFELSDRGEEDQPAFEAAQDTASTYFELRDRGEEDQPAFEAGSVLPASTPGSLAQRWCSPARTS